MKKQGVIGYMASLVEHGKTTDITTSSEDICKNERNTCSCHGAIEHNVRQTMKVKINELKNIPLENTFTLCSCMTKNHVTCENDVSWMFVCKCLSLLDELCKLTDELKCAESVLFGVKDEKTIKGTVELVTAFVVLPNLIKGVGLPAKNTRLHKSQPLKLLHTVRTYFKMLDNQALKDILLPSIRSDLLASLIQLGYKPLRKTADSSQCCCHDTGVCLCCDDVCTCMRKWCRVKLHEFVTSSYQPVVIKDLLVLQKIAASSRMVWYTNVLGELLSTCLMQPHGVNNVVKALLQQGRTISWQQSESLGKLIAKIPKQVSSKEKYFDIINPQILHILTSRQTKITSQLIMVAQSYVARFLLEHASLADQWVRSELLPTFSMFTNADCIQVKEVQLVKEVTRLTNTCSTNTAVKQLIDSAIYPLFALSILITKFRKPFEALIINLLKKASCSEGVSLIQNLISSRDQKITYDTEESYQTSDIPTESKINYVIHILKETCFEKLRGDLFVDLLGKLSELVRSVKRAEKHVNGHSKELLEIDDKICTLMKQVETISIIAALLDNFGESVLQNTPQIIGFLKNILTWLPCKGDEQLLINDGMTENGTVDMCLMLMSTLLGTGNLSDADFALLHELLPALSDVIQHGSLSASSRKMANDLKVFIATRGTVTSSQHQQQQTKTLDMESEEAYKKALQDLVDPLLPTRGHALMQLTKLVRCRNKWALQDSTKLLEIFHTNLGHEDSYLYLPSVEGLSALVDVHHETVLPVICKMFARFQGTGDLDTEVRMKLCEAIVKSIHVCGDLIPRYADRVVSALLIGLKDADSSIRVSSMSALGDALSTAPQNVNKYVVEIFSAVQHIVSTDSSHEVRRASMQVFSMIFTKTHQLSQTSAEELRDIYRLLKKVHTTDRDELTKMHAGNALDIIDDVVKQDFAKKPELEKKIQILP